MAKYSKQREIILETLMDNQSHPTADWVYSRLKPQHATLSLGTVYRNLNLLAEQGKLKKISMAGEADRFDGELSTHIHFKCVRCGQLSDMEGKAAEVILNSLDQVRDITGHETFSDNIVLEGICSQCKEM